MTDWTAQTIVTDSIERENQKLVQSARVTLVEIDLTQKLGTTLYLTPMNGPHDKPIMFRGNSYIPWPLDLSGFSQTAGSTLPTPTLKIAILDQEQRGILHDTNDMYGCSVRRIQTYARFLDDGETPNPNETLNVEDYVVSEKTSENDTEVALKLRTDFDHAGMKLPRRQAFRTCTHMYRTWNKTTQSFDYSEVECPYTGDNYFDERGNKVSKPEEDAPSFRVATCCKLRFPGGPYPFGGLPGLKRN